MGEWEVVPDDEKNKYRLNTNTGLKSNLYRKALAEGGYEYVYATAGTDKDDIKDWLANLSQPSGLSAQYHDSANNAKMISEDYKESELTFVGHSLGGGGAALNSLVTSSNTLKGRNAITFNASGVSALTKLKEGGIKALLKLETKIRAYITISDPLNLIQNSVSFIGKLMPDVNGTRHYVLPQMLDGHSIENFK